MLDTMTGLPRHAAEQRCDPLHHEVVRGLLDNPKRIPCKFLYDARGSALFEAITLQPEYYPTRCEMAILEGHGAEIAAVTGSAQTLVEFGGGAGPKAMLLLAALHQPRGYFSVEIDDGAMTRGLAAIGARWPALQLEGLVADFSQLTALSLSVPANKRLGYLAGSTIGNFEPAEACDLLRRFRRLLGDHSALLIGVDLRKELSIMLPAYDDQAGYTADFNLNLLRRCNRELACDFELEHFAHEARYSAHRSRIEMHLKSQCRQSVNLPGATIYFDVGETIHTENSHKYGIDDFKLLARVAGWEPVETWLDTDKLFSVHFLRASVDRPPTRR